MKTKRLDAIVYVEKAKEYAYKLYGHDIGVVQRVETHFTEELACVRFIKKINWKKINWFFSRRTAIYMNLDGSLNGTNQYNC